jgi:D-amino-acid dehydrogenase
MKMLVPSAGVIGTTTAYYLARAGHEVMVVDHPQPGLARETN